MPRPTRCTAQPPGTPDPTRPLLLQNTPKSEQEARVPPKSPQKWGFASGIEMQGADFPCGMCPWGEHRFHRCFYRVVWVKSSPSFAFHVFNLFFFLLKCHIHGKRGKGALPEHSGDMQGKKTGRGKNPRDGALPRLGSYSLMNLLVRNFTVRAAGWEGLGEDSTVTPRSSAPCAPTPSPPIPGQNAPLLPKSCPPFPEEPRG